MDWIRRLGAVAALAWLTLLAAIGAQAQEIAAQGPRAQSPHVTATLLSDHEVAAPGQTVMTALRLEAIPNWHTYYRNPGDSGEGATLTWSLPAGWSAGEMQWPTPSIVFEGPIATYAYYGAPTFPVELTIPADAQPGAYPVSAEAFWLVCETICVPEWATLSLVLEVAAEPIVSVDHDVIEAALELLPAAASQEGALSAAGDTLALEFPADAFEFAPGDARKLYFFPDTETAIEHALEQASSFVDGVWRIEATLQTPVRRPFSELTGIVALGDKGEIDRPAYRVSARAGEPIGAAPAAASGEPGGQATGGGAAGLGAQDGEAAGGAASGGGAAGPMSAPRAMLFALIGGMILNLMPCVFPVLSMKAAGFVQHAHEPAALRRHGLLFTLGVLVAFAGLFALIMSLRGAAGGAGWGFQLQNPIVVFALIMVMTAVGLSLAGVFELGGSLQNVGAGGGGETGDTAFNTGLLAVIVAAPCTAPFMAPALGFAFVQPPVVAGAVFLALAAGFALPMLALSYMPWLWRAMPRPGPWMVTLKTVLAFPMFLTAAWLVWVLEGVAGGDAVLLALAAAVALAFGLWLWGRSQHASGRSLVSRTIALAAFAAVVFAGAQTPTVAAEAVSAEISSTQTAAGAWSPERVAALRAEGRIVYVDFTAKWCITCQANKRTVILTDTIQDAFAERGVAFLTADWTKRDPAITAELQKFGRAGVPLNIIYGPQGVSEVEILPSLLTQDIVISALDRVEERAALARP